MQSRHWQSGFHFLIYVLKKYMDVLSFMVWGAIDHIFGYLMIEDHCLLSGCTNSLKDFIILCCESSKLKRLLKKEWLLCMRVIPIQQNKLSPFFQIVWINFNLFVTNTIILDIGQKNRIETNKNFVWFLISKVSISLLS